jgi:exopolyphosphatase/guanosine-5'-triphosphate,3'-diphosphate pyrophosphatase
MVRVKKVEVVASIDVGSNYIRMSIAEIGLKGDIIILENIIKTTNIGRDTFTTGRIAVQTIHETCDILKGFVRLMKDYRVIEYKAVSTSGIREAENKQYILEQIRLRTGINVEDINTAQERFFTYKAIRNQLKNIKMENAEQTLIVNITSGAVEISIYEEGQLKLTETAKVGSLRIREKLAGLETKTMDFNKLIRDFIESKIYLLKSNVINKPIKYFIGLGGELGTIAEVIKKRGFYSEKEDFISKETFDELCREIYLMSDEYISFTYDLPKKKSVLLLPSILIFQCFLEITDAEGIYIAEASLRQGILHDIAEKLFEMPEKIESFNDIISSAWYIVDKYGVNREHAAFVQNIALSIFDQTLKLHKLEERERLYLQIAAILHDVGCFIKIVGHNIHSYNIISKQDFQIER